MGFPRFAFVSCLLPSFLLADPVDSLACQEGWAQRLPSPCIALSDMLPFSTWNDPCVVKVGNQFIMYLTTADAPGKTPVRPWRAVSRDGTKWDVEPVDPLLEPGPSEAFDAMSIETPSVVRLGGLWHLYYTGVKSGLAGPMAIGHAISTDGIRWGKDERNPVLKPGPIAPDFTAVHVAEPGAVAFRDKIYLFFSAVEVKKDRFPPARRVIALATSTDGSTFSAPKIVLRQGAVYPLAAGFDGYSTPAAAVIEGRMHLFYDVGCFDPTAERKWTQVAIHHASSLDGETGWIEDARPVFTRKSLPWTAMEIRSPAPLVDGDRLLLYFAGNDYPANFIPEVRLASRTARFGIGCASLEVAGLSR